jgi:serine/threonine-protein kinase
MLSPRTEHALVRGLLALREKLISAEQLAELVREWVSEEDGTFAELLGRAASISTREIRLLDTLAEHFVQLADGQAVRALWEQQGDPKLAHLLEDVPDPQLHLWLRQVDPDGANGGGTLPFVPRDDQPTQRFRKIGSDPLNRGGIGQVFVGEDREVPRQIALKELRSKFADDLSQRLLLEFEARVTGNLQHPGVPPIYGMGRGADGRPFFAMLLIEGVTFQHKIDCYHARTPAERSKLGCAPGDCPETFEARAMTQRQLLRSFINICDVMEYAHSRQIIHRDLKPVNVMIGRYGETYVIDWGLARKLETSEFISDEYKNPIPIPDDTVSSVPRSQMGLVVGTPQFMSPEQAHGQHEIVDHRSDIFSLGSTLYCLLTGQPPYQGSVDEKLKRARERKFSPPRTVNPRISKPLESICLKAMAVDREARYSSAHALALDLEHWLAHERVSCYRENMREQLARLMRRHWAWTQAGGAALLMIAVVAMLSAWFIDGARDDEFAAKQEATKMSRLAQDNADALLTKVSEDLENLPGATQVRRDLLQQAAMAYEQFAGEETDDPQLRAELGRAQLRLGLVRRSLGELDEARHTFTRAVEQFESLHGEQLQEPDFTFELGRSYNELARVENDLHLHEAAAEHHKQALELFNGLLRVHTTNRDYQSQQAAARLYLGTVRVDTQEWDAALQMTERARRDFEDLVDTAQMPALVELRYQLGRTHNNLGVAKRELNYPLAEVDGHYDAAIDHYEFATDERPNVAKYQDSLFSTQKNRGNLYLRTICTCAPTMLTGR